MVQGSCATAPGPALSKPGGADLRPLLPGQCLLLTDTSLLTVSNSSLWLDNLYVRLKRTTRTPLDPVLLTTEAEAPALFLSGITLQVPPATTCCNALPHIESMPTVRPRGWCNSPRAAHSRLMLLCSLQTPARKQPCDSSSLP